jgi:hypothetical protein
MWSACLPGCVNARSQHVAEPFALDPAMIGVSASRAIALALAIGIGIGTAFTHAARHRSLTCERVCRWWATEGHRRTFQDKSDGPMSPSEVGDTRAKLPGG